MNPAGRKRILENDRQYQLRTAEEVAYRNNLDQARMQQQQRQLAQAQQRGRLRAQAKYGDKTAKKKLEAQRPPPLFSQPKKTGNKKTKPVQLYTGKDMLKAKNLSLTASSKKVNKPTPKKYVIQNGVAYPVAKPKTKKKKTKEGDFNWKDFGMPSWKDLMK